MKVIRQPPKPPNPLYQLSCDGCKALVECHQEELELKHDSRDGDAYVLACPSCAHLTWFDVRVIEKYEVKAES